ncbi:hypothetical protein [Cellulomonas sp. URHB0016]
MYEPDASSSAIPIVGIILIVLFEAAIVAFAVYCYVRVARKAGYSGWYAALCFVPIANIVVLIMFCFQEWPIERELRELRAAVGGYPGQVGYPAYAAPGTSQWGQPAAPASWDTAPPQYPQGYGQQGPGTGGQPPSGPQY